MRHRLLGAMTALILTACTQKSETVLEAPPDSGAGKNAAPAASTAFSEVDQSLKTGSFDDAAARLLEMRTIRSDFTPKEAAEYRRKLNEAYSAALEAAEKGDPRAKAAIEMIRANPGR